MAGGISFQVDDRQVTRLRLLFGQAPKEAAKAAAALVNAEAFKFRETAPRVLDTRYHIRSPKFVQSRFRVTKADGAAASLEGVRAEVGTIETARFSGWAEPVTGEASGQNRLLTLNARGGDADKTARPAMRLKPNLDIPDENDFSGVSEDSRFAAFIKSLTKKNHKGTFILRGGKFKPGLYSFGKGKKTITTKRGKPLQIKPIQTVQIFGEKPEPKRWDWREETVKRVQRVFSPSYVVARFIKPYTDKLFSGGK